ncbi:protein FAM187B [Hyperolius riggenbachi]|uniref:protein FAM187B n=1 Tax=Hyperolius riggenbachi TaxID=752182 RepID=UPI0035A2F4FA
MEMVILTVLLQLPVLCGTTSAGYLEGDTFECRSDAPCRVPIASDNTFTLKCGNQSENASVYWQYVDTSNTHTRPVTFLQSSGSLRSEEDDLDYHLQMKIKSLASRSSLNSGHLKILSPKVEDTGLYICKAGWGIPARYEVDVQDVTTLHITHAGLRQNPLSSSAMDVGNENTVEIYTVWSQWQACDRCGAQGERKKVGFCYAEISRDALLVSRPQPCGLLRTTFRDVQINHPVELRIEMCQEDCKQDPSTRKQESLIELVENIHTYQLMDAVLTCPRSSIYRPVYWEHDSSPITRLQILTSTSSYTLDNSTGGGTLYIHQLDGTTAGTYHCYMERNLVKSFQVMFPEVKKEEEEKGFTIMELILVVLGVCLFSYMIFSLCQVLRTIRPRVIP